MTCCIVGRGDPSVAFDGTHIRVANSSSHSVTRLRAIDGVNMGTFPVGANPSGVAFDGANIWVSNNSSNDVTKLRASDGTNLGDLPGRLVPDRHCVRRRQHLGGELR
jgi:DNA-binding beta-propeller fold protein YncE